MKNTLRQLPFANFLSSFAFREEGISVASKEMLPIPDGFETFLRRFTKNSALSVNIWNNQSNKMEVSSRGGKKPGGD